MGKSMLFLKKNEFRFVIAQTFQQQAKFPLDCLECISYPQLLSIQIKS